MARVSCLLLISSVLLLAPAYAQDSARPAAQLHPRRMLLSTQSTKSLLCPERPNSATCYPDSWWCKTFNCADFPCCQQPQPTPYIPDPPTPPTPVPPPYVSGQCWDDHAGHYVDNGVMLTCWRGGTRMCQNGQWRVTYGDCEGHQYYNPNSGNSEVLVGSSNPNAGPAVVASAQASASAVVAASGQKGR